MQEVLSIALTNAIVASVFAIVVFTITRVVKAPSLARALWILVLAKLVTPPLFVVPISYPNLAVENPAPELLSEKVAAWPFDATAPVGAPDPERESETVSLSGPVLVHGAEFSAEYVELEEVTGAAHSQRVDTEAAQGKYRRAGSKQATSSESDEPIVDWAALVGSLWGAGSGLLFLVLLVRTARFQRLLRQAGKAPDSTQKLARELAGRIGLRRLPEMRVVDARVSPFVWSYGLRPKVILPRNLLGSLEEEDLSLVLTHELSHIKRGDHWVRWFETAPLLLFWWCPVVWFVRRELRLAEEQCSDASVTELFPDSNCRYVETLVTVCDLQGGRCASDFALGFNESSTTRRCRMILNQKDVRSRLGLFTTLCLSCAAILLLPLSADVSGQTEEIGTTENVELKPIEVELIPTENVELKPIEVELIPIFVELKPIEVEFTPIANPPVKVKSLESRLQRLEKLVEKLVGALEAGTTLKNPLFPAVTTPKDQPQPAGENGNGGKARKQLFERLEAIDKAVEKLNLERRQLLNSPLLREGKTKTRTRKWRIGDPVPRKWRIGDPVR